MPATVRVGSFYGCAGPGPRIPGGARQRQPVNGEQHDRHPEQRRGEGPPLTAEIAPAVRVMLVDDNPARAAMVEERLWGCGFEVSLVIPSAAGGLFEIEGTPPDVGLIDLESPDRDVVESLAIIRH